jgi:hypothetical protein
MLKGRAEKSLATKKPRPCSRVHSFMFILTEYVP